MKNEKLCCIAAGLTIRMEAAPCTWPQVQRRCLKRQFFFPAYALQQKNQQQQQTMHDPVCFRLEADRHGTFKTYTGIW